MTENLQYERPQCPGFTGLTHLEHCPHAAIYEQAVWGLAPFLACSFALRWPDR